LKEWFAHIDDRKEDIMMSNWVSIPELLSGANAFEISDIQEDEIAARFRTKRQNVAMLHCIANLAPYQFARDRITPIDRGRPL
jgi:hypothetical protein